MSVSIAERPVPVGILPGNPRTAADRPIQFYGMTRQPIRIVHRHFFRDIKPINMFISICTPCSKVNNPPLFAM